MTSTVERARGRWREILPQLGIETRFLVNRHGPCPLCGGRDRYRFDDRDGSGSYFCNQCGAGAGLILVRKLNGWDHATACAEVDKILGDAADERQAPAAPANDDCSKRAAAVQRCLAEARRPEIVTAYLHRRPLSVTSEAFLGHGRCSYYR